ncbi:lyase [Sarracenia purpurea var. burkii]
MWSHIVFDHPVMFETLAMEPNKKREIINDLITLSKAKDYYTKIKKVWKHGYLLHGPPGTGKSTMIAAMANLLEYDLELTCTISNR